MNINYHESLTNIVNSYVGKESLCMLLLASSILFYDMAKKHSDIPPIYALLIAIFLILYSAVIGIFSVYEFNFQINDILKKCSKHNCDIDLTHFNAIKNFYNIMGIIYAILLVYISYILIRFDK